MSAPAATRRSAIVLFMVKLLEGERVAGCIRGAQPFPLSPDAPDDNLTIAPRALFLCPPTPRAPSATSEAAATSNAQPADPKELIDP
ncbi:hypothetical protein GCM10027430_16650 [Lysobacter tyrosinilyticus]